MVQKRQLIGNGNNGSQSKTKVISMLLLIVVSFSTIALISIKVLPMYIQYFSIKSTIESIRNEGQLAQMSIQDMNSAVQKRFDISFLNNQKSRTPDIRNDIRNEGGKLICYLSYQDERNLFYGLSIVLNMNEAIPLNP